jgi:hypothetical protein
MREQAEQASNGLIRLSSGPAMPSLTKWNEPPTLEDLRAHVKAARESLQDAQQAIPNKDDGQLKTALRKFHEEYEPIQAAAKRPAK